METTALNQLWSDFTEVEEKEKSGFMQLCSQLRIWKDYNEIVLGRLNRRRQTAQR